MRIQSPGRCKTEKLSSNEGTSELGKRVIAGIILTLLMVNTLVVSLCGQALAAGGTIYIRADGSIDPPTAPISTLDNVTYTFTGSIYDHVVVERNDIVVDGKANLLQGLGPSYDKGIDLTGRSNVTIKNARITKFLYGIYLSSSSNNTVSANNLTIIRYGIMLYSSSNNTVSGNRVTSTATCGIKLDSSFNNVISENKVTSNGRDGIVLYSSSNNTVSGNEARGNTYTDITISSSSNNTLRNNVMGGLVSWSFGVYGDSFSNFVNHVDSTNTVYGKPVYYLINAKDATVPLDAGYVALVNSTNITVRNLDLALSDQGILLVYTTNTTITNNNVADNRDCGIKLWYSFNNTVSGNRVTNGYTGNPGRGIVLHSSSNNTFSANSVTVRGSFGDGIYLYSSANNVFSGNDLKENYRCGFVSAYSDSNTLSGNNITESAVGVQFSGSGNVLSGNKITNNGNYGVQFSGSGNVLSGNKIANNWCGVRPSYATGNTLSENNITDNEYGVAPGDAHGNVLTGNNIANNRYGFSIGWSSGNVLSRNNITANTDYGVWLDTCSGNTFYENNITDNYCGVYLYCSSSNKLFHNNFIENSQQVINQEAANIFDDGYPSGGNYWSDYRGADVKRGASQDEDGSDGIGDTPNIIDDINRDRYPLMNLYGSLPLASHLLVITADSNGTTDPVPGTYTYFEGQTVPVQAVPNTGCVFDRWELDGTNVGSANPYSVLMEQNHMLNAVFRAGLHDIAVTSATPSRNIVVQGNSLSINVTVENRGDYGESFNVTVFANSTQIARELVSNLLAGSSEVLTLASNTTELSPGNYTVRAVADVLANETNTSDNCYVGGVVTIEAVIHDTAVLQLHNMKTDCLPLPTVCQNMTMDIYVILKNEGNWAETFNVTLLANSTEIGMQAVTLDPDENTTVIFKWNASFAEYGLFIFNATCARVPGETELSDNSIVNSNITITHMGDITGDGKVDISDIARVSGSFGSIRVSNSSDPPYGRYRHPTPCVTCPHEPNTDVTGDSKVDIHDLARTSANFGWHM